MRYQVPQFIEIEDKIFGPLTLKQFIYLAGGGGFCYLIYAFLPWFLSYPLILIVAGFATALAFYKVNQKPFINIVEAAFKYSLAKKLYIWKKAEKKAVAKEVVMGKEMPAMYVPKLSGSKLSDLAWSLDISEKKNKTIYSKENRNLEARKDLSTSI